MFEFGESDGQTGARALWYGESAAEVQRNSDAVRENFGNRDQIAGENGIGNPGDDGDGVSIGGWAGTPFFLILGESSFFRRDVLHYDSQPDPEGGETPILEANYTGAVSYTHLTLPTKA